MLKIFVMLSVLALGLPAFANMGDKVQDKVNKMDENNDKKISPEEHARGSSAMFKKMDTNKDGKVTADEMEVKMDAKMDARMDAKAGKKMDAHHGAHEGWAKDKLAKLDTDKDGALTAAEHETGAKSMFTEMDIDKDGFLSAEELKTGHAKKMKK